MSFRAPPVVPPGPLTPADAAALSLYLRELSQCFGSITGAPPISVVQGVSGVNITFDDTGMASAGTTFSGADIYTNVDGTGNTFADGVPSNVMYSSGATYDTDGYFSMSDPDRLTVPTTGYYLVTTGIRLDLNVLAVGVFEVEIDIIVNDNGIPINGDRRDVQSVGISLQSVFSFPAQLFLTAGDYVTTLVTQNSGFSAGCSSPTHMTITKLGS